MVLGSRLPKLAPDRFFYMLLVLKTSKGVVYWDVLEWSAQKSAPD